MMRGLRGEGLGSRRLEDGGSAEHCSVPTATRTAWLVRWVRYEVRYYADASDRKALRSCCRRKKSRRQRD